MTQDELNATLNEFVLFTDNTPESNEPTELSVFLRQCGYDDALGRLSKELLIEFDKALQLAVIEARLDEHNYARENSYGSPDTNFMNLHVGAMDKRLEILTAQKQSIEKGDV